MTTTSMTDVMVFGGGMVGASVALGLAQQNFKVVLFERAQPNLDWSDSEPFQTRVSALTRASENILRELGAWQGIENRRSHPFTAMHVWESLSDGEVHFSASEMNEPNLGYTVENSVVQAALWEQILQQDNIQVVTGLTPSGLSLQSDKAELRFESGETFQAKLLVAADGAVSKMRDMAGISVVSNDYEQCAVVGCVKTAEPHQDTCWQRYRADGPFAYLAMDDNVSSIAWYLPVSKMQWALDLDDESFAKAIAEASDDKLGEVIEVNERAAFPLIRRHAEAYVKPHFVLVGDAAHSIHPQAGQGVNLGLLDAAALIETLVSARAESNKDWSRYSVLRRYERWRRGDNATVQRSMEAFDWLFKQDNELKNQVRKAFLPLANGLSPIKNWLMSQALNGREALPQLAKRRLMP